MYNYSPLISPNVVQLRTGTFNIYVPALIEPPESIVHGFCDWLGFFYSVNNEVQKATVEFNVPEARRNTAYNGRDYAVRMTVSEDTTGSATWLVNTVDNPAGLYRLDLHQRRTGQGGNGTKVGYILCNLAWESGDRGHKTVTQYRRTPQIKMYDR